jgi:hypothetical protein
VIAKHAQQTITVLFGASLPLTRQTTLATLALCVTVVPFDQNQLTRQLVIFVRLVLIVMQQALIIVLKAS